MVMKKNAIVYVPGLNDDGWLNKKLIRLLPAIWKRYEYKIYPVYPHWRREKNFARIQARIVAKIDALAAENYTIYIIGQSAGASAVLNSYILRKTIIENVVNICGRL